MKVGLNVCIINTSVCGGLTLKKIMNERLNKDESINYLYDDLSKIDTKKLKLALVGYKNFKHHGNGEEAILRIEGELLSRKELDVKEEDVLEEEKVLQEEV
jgi:hypothetical protein